METNPQQQTEAGPSLEQIGVPAEHPPKEQAIEDFCQSHKKRAQLEQAEMTTRDKALEKIRTKIYGAGSEQFQKAMTDRMQSGGAIALSRQEADGLEKLRKYLHAAEATRDIKRLGDTTDVELDAALAAAKPGEMEQREVIETPLELDIEDIAAKQVEAEVDKAFEALLTKPTVDEEIDAAFENIQQPPEQKKAA